MAGSPTPVFVGRDHELRAVQVVVDHAVEGEAGAILVTGDAGVGKSALVAQALRDKTGIVVLQGGCLPLGSFEIPLAPLHAALRHATEAVPRPPDLLGGDRALASAPTHLDDWLDGACAATPIVLSVDDLHWADGHTLDVLMYLLAGRRDRRLAMVATIRGTELGVGRRINSWLADVRRLPGIVSITVGPLSLAETLDQLTGLLGGPPHESLGIAVYERTGGNAYLNRLLVSHLDVTDRALPTTLPDDLQEALIANWHRLSPATRHLTAVIALAGLPLSALELDKAVSRHLPHLSLEVGLAEAVAGHVLEIAADGRYWFHHPLQAEVLRSMLLPDEQQRWHEIFASFLKTTVTDERDTVTLIRLAEHHFAAEHGEDALRSALQAADAASASAAYVEAIRLLRRAVHLLAGAELPERVDLLQRVRELAERSGDLATERVAIDDLLALLDPDRRPLAVAALMVRRVHLRQALTEDFAPVAEIEQAVRLASGAPTSWEYGYALADQARLAFWTGDPSAGIVAERALSAARAAREPRALSHALTAMAMAEESAGRPRDAVALARQAQQAAAEARDFWGYVHATMWHANAVATWSSAEYGQILHDARIEAAGLGAPAGYLGMLAVGEAAGALAIGQWRACASLLRGTLGAAHIPICDVQSRLVAARLAALQGRPEEAQAHLDRAREISSQLDRFPPFEFSAVTAEVQLHDGKPEDAARTTLTALAGGALNVTMCEWLVPLAARALADVVQRTRETHEVSASADRELAMLEDAYPPPPSGTVAKPSIIADTGVISALYARQLEALALWYAAECGRAHDRPGNGDEWDRAAEALVEAQLPWEAAYSAYRAAEAHLRSPHPDRHAAARAVRSAAEASRRLEAEPLRERAARLARAARISLRLPTETAPTQLVGLTRREQEILTHVVAGRTYREIADALVLSEKTVSSHISNMLRKTGAPNRVELARRAVDAPSAS